MGSQTDEKRIETGENALRRENRATNWPSLLLQYPNWPGWFQNRPGRFFSLKKLKTSVKKRRNVGFDPNELRLIPNLVEMDVNVF
jgi:hypothetical protein